MTDNKILKTVFLYFGFFALSLFFIPLSGKAATLYLDPVVKTIGPDDVIEVKVKIGVASGECINAAQIGINFPSDILEVKDFNSGESFLSLWIARPDKDSLAKINSSGKIMFSGGTPGGYCGKIPGDPGDSNILGSIIFTPKKPISFHKAKIDFNSETQAYLNDGVGTAAALNLQGAVLDIDEKITEITDGWAEKIAADLNPPEAFVITIDNSVRIADGKFFVVFSTTDKETGIDHYEVLEDRTNPSADKKSGLFAQLFSRICKPKVVVPLDWKKADSPYILKDQALRSVIRVKAVDRAGNERVVEYNNAAAEVLKKSAFLNSRYLEPAIIALFVILFVAVPAIAILKKRKKAKKY
jgi:hypothetical protein